MEETTVPGIRYLELPYRLILTKEKRKGSETWLALVEELPGCEARADTAEEAVAALRAEMAGWIGKALGEGRPIPRPRTTPRPPDGRLTIELPQSLHGAITHAAVREGLPVDKFVTIALAGVTQWIPGSEDAESAWIESRAKGLMRGDGERSVELRRAIVLNAALLALVAVAAVVILIVALAHGF